MNNGIAVVETSKDCFVGYTICSIQNPSLFGKISILFIIMEIAIAIWIGNYERNYWPYYLYICTYILVT